MTSSGCSRQPAQMTAANNAVRLWCAVIIQSDLNSRSSRSCIPAMPGSACAASAQAQDASCNRPSPVSAIDDGSGREEEPLEHARVQPGKERIFPEAFLTFVDAAAGIQRGEQERHGDVEAEPRRGDVDEAVARRVEGCGWLPRIALELRRDLDEARHRGDGVARGEAEPRRTADAHQSFEWKAQARELRRGPGGRSSLSLCAARRWLARRRALFQLAAVLTPLPCCQAADWCKA